MDGTKRGEEMAITALMVCPSFKSDGQIGIPGWSLERKESSQGVTLITMVRRHTNPEYQWKIYPILLTRRSIWKTAAMRCSESANIAAWEERVICRGSLSRLRNTIVTILNLCQKAATTISWICVCCLKKNTAFCTAKTHSVSTRCIRTEQAELSSWLGTFKILFLWKYAWCHWESQINFWSSSIKMERRVRWKVHARCGLGEKTEALICARVLPISIAIHPRVCVQAAGQGDHWYGAPR